jgi:hypothetical protein
MFGGSKQMQHEGSLLPINGYCNFKIPQERCMKTLTYSWPVDSEREHIDRIVEAEATNSQKPGNFEGTRQFMLFVVGIFIEVDDLTFEYLL